MDELRMKAAIVVAFCALLFARLPLVAGGLYDDRCLNRTQFSTSVGILHISEPPGLVRGQCVHLLVAEPSHYLQVDMITVTVPEEGSKRCQSCMCGLLQFFDGHYFLGEWCYGRITSKIITSLSSELRAVYHPDKTRPFNATFNLHARSITATGTTVITRSSSEDAKSGFITSRGFPRPYEQDAHSLWIFQNQQPGSTLRLSFNDMLLPIPPAKGASALLCVNDIIQIFEGYPHVNDTWRESACGRRYPGDFYSANSIVTVQFEPSPDAQPLTEHSLGFNISYDFLPAATSVPSVQKYIDCGTFNDSERNYGMGFEFGGHRADRPRSLNNQNLRCRWILVAPEPYHFFIINVHNFTLGSNPAAAAAQSLVSYAALPSGSGGSSATLTVKNGLLSSSPVLTSVDLSSESRRTFPISVNTSDRTARIDMLYPAESLGAIQFSYTAARWLEEPTAKNRKEPLLTECDPVHEFKCEYSHKMTTYVKQSSYYCIHHSLICDGVRNCFNGEDEKYCSAGYEGRGSGPLVGGGVTTATIIAVIFTVAIAVLAVPIVAAVYWRKRRNHLDRQRRAQRHAQRGSRGSTRSQSSGGGGGSTDSTGAIMGSQDDELPRESLSTADFQSSVNPSPLYIAQQYLKPPYYTEEPDPLETAAVRPKRHRGELPSVTEEPPTTDDRAHLISNQESDDPFTP